ncbi:MAG: hypothetical protein WCC87_02810 [Candidatus Korobacteraceae bacterium]
MGCVDTNASLELVQRANAHLERFLARFADAAILGTDEEVEATLQLERALQSVAVLLDQGLQKCQDHEVRQELARYRQNLLQLRRELARMQESAMGSRARLYSRQKHLHAAQAWCAASRVTG